MTNIARIWLFLLREGGRWSAPEMVEGTGLKPSQLASALYAMYLRGFVRRHELRAGDPGFALYQYGVDRKCIAPPGIALEDFDAAGLQMKAVNETA